jgi:hypothetical protein
MTPMYSQFLQQMPRLAIDGPGFINPNMPGSSFSAGGGGLSGMQGYGNDFLYPTADRMRAQMLGPNGPGGPIGGMPAAGGGMNIGPSYPGSSIPGASAPPMHAPGLPGMQGYGNDMLYPPGMAGGKPMTDRMPTPPRDSLGGYGYGRRSAGEAQPSATDTSGLFWAPTPLTGSPLASGNRHSYAPPRGPQLPQNEMSHGWATGFHDPNAPNEAGYWNQPSGYIQGNGTSTSRDDAGWWHGAGGHPVGAVAGGQYGSLGAGSAANLLGGGSGATPWGNYGGGGGGGYGGGNPLQGYADQYQQSVDAAKAANLARFNQGLEGYTAIRQRADALLNGLGQQQLKDTNQIFDNRQSGLTQDMISRGLTNSTVQDNQRVGIDTQRANELARVNEALTQQRLGTELPLAEKQINYLSSWNDPIPDLGRMAALMQQAAAGGAGMGGGAGPVNVDLSGMGGGFDNGMMGMPWGMLGGYGNGIVPWTGGSQLQRGSNSGNVPFSMSIDPVTSGDLPPNTTWPGDASLGGDAFSAGVGAGSAPDMWKFMPDFGIPGMLPGAYSQGKYLNQMGWPG